MSKIKPLVTRNASQLAKALGLSQLDAQEWEVQSTLLTELKKIIARGKLTHNQVALAAKTSRTRITSILNGNLDHVSTDLLIRIVRSLGYKVNISVAKSKRAA